MAEEERRRIFSSLAWRYTRNETQIKNSGNNSMSVMLFQGMLKKLHKCTVTAECRSRFSDWATGRRVRCSNSSKGKIFSYKITNKMQMYRIIHYSLVPWLLYMFRATISPIIRSNYLKLQILVSNACVAIGCSCNRQRHTRIKPEAVTTDSCSWWWAILLLETCTAVKEQGNNKLTYTVAFRWSFYKNCIMMHGNMNGRTILLSETSEPATGPTQTHVQWVSGFLLGEKLTGAWSFSFNSFYSWVKIK
jgi:hypothetical protein